MTDQYAELHAEIARLRGDLDFKRDVAEKARAFGPPPGPDVVDHSGYFTALRVDDLLAAGKLREAADPHCTRDRPRCRRRMTAPPWRCSGRPPSRPPLLQPAHGFATERQPQPILWRHSDEVSRGTNNAVLSVGEVALSGVRRRTRQEYRRQPSATIRCAAPLAHRL